MRWLAKEGHKLAVEQGSTLQVLAGVYGPAPWQTKQRIVRGRDLDPGEVDEFLEYAASWAKYLVQAEGLTVRAVSLGNECNEHGRWPLNGTTSGKPSSDYDYWLSATANNDLIVRMRHMLDVQGLGEIAVAPGEIGSCARLLA